MEPAERTIKRYSCGDTIPLTYLHDEMYGLAATDFELVGLSDGSIQAKTPLSMTAFYSFRHFAEDLVAVDGRLEVSQGERYARLQKRVEAYRRAARAIHREIKNIKNGN